MWCCTTLERRLAEQLTKYTLDYSNAGRFVDCIFVVFALSEQPYVRTEHGMCEGIVRHTPRFRVEYLCYFEVCFGEERRKKVYLGQCN